MRERLTVIVLGLLLGAATVLLLLVAGAYVFTRTMGASRAAPTRWQPITPTPTPVVSPTPEATPTPTPTPEGIYVGGRAEVVSQVRVNMRKSPGYRNKPKDDVIVAVPPGSVVEVIGGPKEKDNLRWWQVRWQGKEGWMAEYSSRGTQLLAPK